MAFPARVLGGRERGFSREKHHKVEKRNVVDPLGSVVPVHHTDAGYQVPDKGKCLPLGDESTTTAIGMEFSKAIEEIGRKTKDSVDKDVAVENVFLSRG